MNDLTVKNKENKHPNKNSIYNEFILWTAMPHMEQVRLGLETQGQFAEHYNVHTNTLTHWKNRPDFEERVDKILKVWSTDKTPNVVNAIYKGAIKGNPLSQQLWLGYFKGYNPRKVEDKEEGKVEVSADDFRFIVSVLPEPYKTKFNEYITEIITTANALANARESEDDGWDTPRPEERIPDRPDTDASNVSDVGADAVAVRHTERISIDLGRKTSESYHKGTTWRRQE